MNTSLVGQTLLDQFTVDAFVDSGGMGIVYRVWDIKRNVSLAMKVLHADLAEDPSIFKLFKREANALKKLAHPNIVPFYGLFQTPDFAFLLEHYVDGPTLKDILRNRKGQPLPIQETVTYLKVLSAALGYAHVHGVVHCDVKPGNVMVDRGGGIYLTDFGIARHAESTTTTLATIGTAAYMAPEQIRGEAVTPATDVYALGVLLFEMLTGQRPFRGTEAGTESSGATAAERVRYAHLHLPPPDPQSFNPSLSSALAEVIMKALAKVPGERYQSVLDLFAAVCVTCAISMEDVPDRISLSSLPEMPSIVIEGKRVTGDVIGRAMPKQRLRTGLATIGVGVIVVLLLWSIIIRPTNGPIINTPTAGGRGTITTNTTGIEIATVATRNATKTTSPTLTLTRTLTPSKTSTPTRKPRPTSSPTLDVYYPIPNCAPSRLRVGDWAYISFVGGHNAIRNTPDTHPSDNIIGYAEEGNMLDIIGGPECNYGYILWEVRSAGGLVGWTPETDGNEFYLILGTSWRACPGAPISRLSPGDRAFVSYDPPLPNTVRINPGYSALDIGKIQPGEKIAILDGPACRNNLVWWEVRALDKSLRGWTAEGDAHDYWLVPIP